MSKYGPGKRRIMRTFKLSSVSLVDSPAQKGADVVLLKRDDAASLPKASTATLAKAKFVVMTSSDEGHSHLVEDWSYDGQTPFAGTTSSSTSEDSDMSHSHPWMVDENGEIVIGDSDGHSHTIESKSMLAAMARFGARVAQEAAERLAAQAKYARDDGAPDDSGKGEPAPNDAGSSMDAGNPGEGDGQMGKPTSADPGASGGPANGEAAVLAELTKRCARAETLAALDDGAKRFLKSQSPTEQDRLLDGAAVEITKAAARAAEQDPVVHTSSDGTVYRKSDDARLVAMAKRADESERLAKAERDRARRIELTKRAEDELGHLPGEAVAKIALLDVIDSIPDAKAREGALALLKAADDAASPSFDTLGVRGKVGGGAADSKEGAEATLEKMARDAMTKTPGLSFGKAYQQALNTPEGEALYAKVV